MYTQVYIHIRAYTAHRRLSSPRDRPGDISRRIKRICDHGGNVNGTHFGVPAGPAAGLSAVKYLAAEQDMTGRYRMQQDAVASATE